MTPRKSDEKVYTGQTSKKEVSKSLSRPRHLWPEQPQKQVQTND